MSEEVHVSPLKQIPLDANSFQCGERTYLIHSSLSVFRFRKLNELQVRAFFGADYQTLYQALEKAYDLLNRSKPADAAVAINGTLEGVARELNNQPHPMLLICTLFCAEASEDLATWNEAKATETIEEWSAAGYDVQTFFALGLRLVRQFATGLQPDSLVSSQ